MWAYGSWRGVSAAKHDQVFGEGVGSQCQGVHASFNCVSAAAKELNLVALQGHYVDSVASMSTIRGELLHCHGIWFTVPCLSRDYSNTVRHTLGIVEQIDVAVL
eukprot:1988647-Amphidinium_carterae.1